MEAARRLAAAEWALASLVHVVPRVDGVAPAGYGAALDDSSKTWALSLGPEGVEVCGAWAACETVLSLDRAIERMGLAPRAERLELSIAEARDAATLYGLRGNGRRSRGESGAGGLWIRARRQLEGGASGRATVQLQRAVSRQPDQVALHAALGRAFAQNRQPAEALRVWRRLEGLSPQDPRFEAQHLAAESAAGRQEAVRARLQSLPPHLRALPQIVSARAAAGTADPAPTEARTPVRSVDGALELRRGRPSPAEIEQTLARTRDPVALVARGEARLSLDRPRDALKDADSALKRSPWLPEALALKAASLDALGRHEDARQVRGDLRFADPGSGLGPRRLQNAREVGEGLDQSD